MLYSYTKPFHEQQKIVSKYFLLYMLQKGCQLNDKFMKTSWLYHFFDCTINIVCRRIYAQPFGVEWTTNALPD